MDKSKLNSVWTWDRADAPGPLQIRRFKEAHSKFNWVAGEYGEEGADGRVWYYRILVGGSYCDAAYDLMNRIGDHFHWTLSRKNCKDVIAMLNGALPALRAARPVKKYVEPQTVILQVEDRPEVTVKA
jgi:hypothetical protein